METDQIKRKAERRVKTPSVLPIDFSASVSLKDLAYRRIREAIVEHHFESGARINERNLASALGVSTSPVKDALRRLETEGMVVTLPRRGTFVSSFSQDDARELDLLRAALEATAAQLAAERFQPTAPGKLPALLDKMRKATAERAIKRLVSLNEEFHSEIHRTSRVSHVPRLLNLVWVQNSATRKFLFLDDQQIDQAFAEHEAIAGAIFANAPDRAAELMHEHVLRSAEAAKRIMLASNRDTGADGGTQRVKPSPAKRAP